MSVSYNWWGFRIRLSHDETTALSKALCEGGAGEGAILAESGVGAVAVAIVAAAIGLAALWIAASDDGNGVAICSTWCGVVWVENPPAWA